MSNGSDNVKVFPGTTRSDDPTYAVGGGGGGGSDGSGGIHISLITPYIDAKMGQVQTELVTRLDQSVRQFEDQLKGLPSSAAMWKAVGAILLGLASSVGAIFGILSWTGDRVDGGVAASLAYKEEMVSARLNDAEQKKSLAEVNSKIDKLLDASKKQ